MNVGFNVGVFDGVDVCVMVALCEAVGLIVGVSASGVKTTTAVDVGTITVGVGIGVGVAGGLKNGIAISASNITPAIIIGMAYLRSSIGKVNAGTTGISPEYPNAVNRLFRLAA